LGLKAPFPDYKYNRLVEGIKKIKKHTVQRAAIMTPRILKDIGSTIDKTDVFQVVAWTAVLIGFYLFLRKSNLVSDSAAKFDPGKQLVRSDVVLEQRQAVVKIRWSKTNQTNEKTLKVPLSTISDQRICPLYWLRLMGTMVAAKPSTPLFNLCTKGGFKPLTYRLFSNFLKGKVKALGLDGDRFTPHCLRRGGCTWAYNSNIPETSIQVMGDWSSLAYRTYIQINVNTRMKDFLMFIENLDY